MGGCYCGDTPRSNHVHFRFAGGATDLAIAGGATDLAKRSRRLQLIARVVEEQGFGVRIRGDLLLARLANVGAEALIGILGQLGSLMAYTRQLDARLRDDADVERLAERFMAGRYELE